MKQLSLLEVCWSIPAPEPDAQVAFVDPDMWCVVAPFRQTTGLFCRWGLPELPEGCPIVDRSALSRTAFREIANKYENKAGITDLPGLLAELEAAGAVVSFVSRRADVEVCLHESSISQA